MEPKSNKPFSIYQLIRDHREEILDGWIKSQLAATTFRPDLLKEEQLRAESGEFLAAFVEAISGKDIEDIHQKSFDKVRKFLTDLSRSRAAVGFSPTETASFIFSLKTAILPNILDALKSNPEMFFSELTLLNDTMDKLGLITFETFAKSREEVIHRQTRQVLEMATPIIQVWESILSVPLIGTLDSARTQIVMEKLLEKIVETKSRVAIIDITGVLTVDTMVAQHLMKTVQAIRLLGAECVITGISAPVAQTMVQMGVEFRGVITRSLMAEGIRFAFDKMGKKVQ